MIDDDVNSPAAPTNSETATAPKPPVTAQDTDIKEDRLLRLQVTVGNPQGLLPDIATFLNQLIECNLGENGGNNYILTPFYGEPEPKDLLLRVVDKRIQESARVLYLSDVYSLAEDILGLLQRSFMSSPAVRELLQSEDFSRGLLEEIRLENGLISESKAFDRRRELFHRLQELSVVINSLLTDAQAEAAETLGSIRDIAYATIAQRPLTSWDSLVEPLAQAYRQLEENSTVITLNDRIGGLEPGNYIAGELPLVFNDFSRTIARVALQNNNRDKLKAETLSRLQNVERQDFYFGGVEENDPNIALKRKLPSHTLTTQRFLSFFGEEVIPYLEGAKKLEVAPVEDLEAAPDSEAAEPTPPIEPNKVPADQFIEEIRKEVAKRVADELQVNRIVLENVPNTAFLKRVVDQVTTLILANLSSDSVQATLQTISDQAQAAGVTFYDATTNTVEINETTQQYVEDVVRTLTQEFLATGLITADTIIELIGEAGVDEFVSKENPESLQPIAQRAALVQRLPALTADTDIETPEWQQLSPQEKIIVLQKSGTWWSQLPIDKRAQFLNQTKFVISFNTVVQSVSFDSIRDYLAQNSPDAATQAYFRSLSPELLSTSPLYSQLQTEISTYLLTQLSAEELFSLFYSQDRLRVWRSVLQRVQGNLNRSRFFPAYLRQLTTQFDEQLTKANAAIVPTDIDVSRLDQNLDAIYVLVKNPTVFVGNLDIEMVEKYFGITLKSESELRQFRFMILKRLALRRSAYQTDGLVENQAEIDQYLPQVRSLSRSLPSGGMLSAFTEAYDDGLDEDIQQELDQAELDHYKQLAQAKRVFLEQMWSTLEKEEKRAVYEQLGMPAAAGAQFIPIPRGVRLENIFQQFTNRGTKAKPTGLRSLTRFIPGFLNPKKQLNPTTQFFNAVETAGVAATASIMNAAIPLSGTAFQAATKLAKLLGIDTKKAFAILGTLAAMYIGLIIKSLTTFMGILGATIGGVVGFAGGLAVGAPIPAAIFGAANGSIAGYGIGQVTGINSINFGDAVSKAFGSLFPGGGAAPVPLLPAAMPAATMACAVGVSLFVQNTAQGAFLNPLPTIGDNDISPYVEIQKVAVEGTQFDTPTDITYAIRIKARQGYSITLTEAPTDEFEIRVNPNGPAGNTTTPTGIPISPEYEVFHSALSQYVGRTIDSQNYLELGTYRVPFGTNPGDNNYNDANILNKFGITFTVTVTDPNAVPPEGEGPQTAFTAEVVCFGECPQAAGGCWPTSGIITQMPFGPDSHARLRDDAYDIANVIRTRIYAPYGGTVTLRQDPSGYGNYVRLDADTGRSFVFGHMDDYADGLGSGTTVAPGDFLGYMGNTGFVIGGQGGGVHLHYEIDQNGAFGAGTPPSQLTPIVPDPQASVGDPVRSCYDPQ